jgi:hypothetical protein
MLIMEGYMPSPVNFDNLTEGKLYANSLRRILKNLRTATIDTLAHVSNFEHDIVRRIVTELCRHGEFEQSGETFRFNEKHCLVLVICVFEKKRVCTAVSDLYGEYLEKRESSENPSTLDYFDSLIQDYLSKYPSIGILVFGMAGIEDRKSRLLMTHDFPETVRFRDHVMKKYGLSVIIENDINAAALGYYETRDFEEGKCICSLYFPQSQHPGGAVCINGNIHRGRDNMAGEVSFLKTAIQWKHFEKNYIDYSKIDIPSLICDMALPAIVYLNPDCLVVYGDWLPENSARELELNLKEIMPREFVPDIVFIPDILQDFLDGLTRLALRELEQKTYFYGNME